SNLVDSLETLQSALEIFRAVSSKSEEAEVLKDLAIVYWELDRQKLAIESCNKALAMATQLDIPLVKDCQELKQALELSIK
ncbi:tetratricopeptide repeat protein, partial [Roseofilum casamattae]